MDEETQEVVPAEVEQEEVNSEQKFEDQKRRAEKAEQEAKILKDKLGVLDKLQTAFNPEEEVPEEPQGPDPSARVDELEETLILKDKGYSTEEVIAMRNYAKGAGKKTTDVESDPFIKATIDKMREETEVAQTTPPPSTSAPGPSIGSQSDIQYNDDGTVKPSKHKSFAEWEAERASKGKSE